MFIDSIRTIARAIFKIDVRALAAFRICLGLLILSDLIIRCGDIDAHYSDSGVLPRSVVISNLISKYYFSIHLINGLPEFQLFLFAINALVAILLIIGYRTRLMTFIAWVFLTSLNNRMIMVSTGGDTLLRLALFWSMFLPLDHAYQIKNKKSKVSRYPTSTCSTATAALLLQVIFVYFFTAIMKGKSWYEGTAVYLALHIDLMATTPAYWLREYEELLRYITFGTLAFEGFGPLLLLQPLPLLRIIGVFLFASMHSNFGIFLALGLFPFVSITCLIPFLPSVYWDKFDTYIDRFVIPRLEALNARLRYYPDLLLYRLGRSTGVASPHTPRPVIQLLVLFFLCIVVAFNLGSQKGWKTPLPDSIRHIGLFLKLNQSWNMFVNPLRGDGWFVLPGKLVDGTEVDVWTNSFKPVSYEKPARVNLLFKNYRWRKYYMNIRKKKFRKTRRYLGRWLCRRWNNTHPVPLKSFRLYFMREETLLNTREFPLKKLKTMSYTCSK